MSQRKGDFPPLCSENNGTGWKAFGLGSRWEVTWGTSQFSWPEVHPKKCAAGLPESPLSTWDRRDRRVWLGSRWSLVLRDPTSFRTWESAVEIFLGELFSGKAAVVRYFVSC